MLIYNQETRGAHTLYINPKQYDDGERALMTN